MVAFFDSCGGEMVAKGGLRQCSVSRRPSHQPLLTIVLPALLALLLLPLARHDGQETYVTRPDEKQSCPDESSPRGPVTRPLAVLMHENGREDKGRRSRDEDDEREPG